jgi:hypothetical protein
VGDEPSIAKRPVEVIDRDTNGQPVAKVATRDPVDLIRTELAEAGNVLTHVRGEFRLDRAVAARDHDPELQHSAVLRVETGRLGVHHGETLGEDRRIHDATVLRGCGVRKVRATE